MKNTLNKKDSIAFINIYKILKLVYGRADINIVKSAMSMARRENPKNINDYYYLIFKSIIENKKIKKVAYPILQGALTDEPPEEYNLEKWSDLVYKIYDAVITDDMTFNNALDYYSSSLDCEGGEDFRFKEWVKYYKDGEHQKYSKDEVPMKKNSKYQFPLNGSGLYSENYIPELEREHPIHKVKEDVKLNDEYRQWKAKLYAAIRRIDKLLRQAQEFISPENESELAAQLHNFDMELRKVKMYSTASDLALKRADQFEKLGFDDGAEILRKFAQEAPPVGEDIIPEEISASPAEAAPPVTEEAAPTTPPQEEQVSTPEEAESPLRRSLDDSVGEPHAYDDLAGDITIELAARKLEEAASKLADRRTIRLLAEFDIMLDKLGIAAMFPELAESQSKLIDAYSYALTRVTKMLGMLSGGMTLVELGEARKGEIEGKTMKEIQKGFEQSEAPPDKVEPGERMQQEVGGSEVEVAPPETLQQPRLTEEQ